MPKHPMQKMIRTNSGVVRFVENKIVVHLLETAPESLNALCARFQDSPEDYEQFMMLIGYTVSGFVDMSQTNKHRAAGAQRSAEKLCRKVSK